VFLQDTLTNLITGLGTDRDKVMGGRFNSRRLDAAELNALYEESWIAGRIVDARAEDETRAWRAWQAGQRQIAALEAEERRLKVRQVVTKARKMARLYGTSYVLLGTGDADPSQQLFPENIRKGGLRYLGLYSPTDISAGMLLADQLSPWFGQPEYYELSGVNGGQVRVHPSRIVRFIGLEPLERGSEINGGGLSVLQRTYEAVTHAAATNAGLAGLAQEAKLDIIKIDGLNQNVLDPNYRSKVIARFGLASQAKSNVSTLLLDKLEEWTSRTVSMSGWPEVVAKFLEVAAASDGYPVSRLLGKAPSGLNSNQEGDTRAYYDGVASGQETMLRPTLEPLDEALIRSALGNRPTGVWYQWASLWQLTDGEKAEIALKKAQAAQIYAGMALLPPTALRKAIRNQLVEDGAYPGLEAALAEADAASEAPAAIVVKQAAAPRAAPEQNQ
jgi:phage-related protein (TIGR01555 family)